MQPPPYGPQQPPPPPYPPPPYGHPGQQPGAWGNPYYQYPAPPRSSGVHPVVWILLAMGLFGAFALAGLFAIGMIAGMRAAAAPPPPAYAPYSGGGYGSGSGYADDDDTDDPTTGGQKGGLGTAPDLPVPDRDVPVLDVKVLEGCSSGDIRMIESHIDDAIDVGAPAYNRGDFKGCYVTYDQAAKDIEDALPRSCKGPKKALEDGRTKAKSKSSAADQAWAMRDAFDGVLDVIDRKGPDL